MTLLAPVEEYSARFRLGEGKRLSGARTLQRGLEVLAAVRAADHSLTASQLARETGLNHAVISRLLPPLVEAEFDQRGSGGIEVTILSPEKESVALESGGQPLLPLMLPVTETTLESRAESSQVPAAAPKDLREFAT